ncbi:hypothetical protein Q4577_01255 [Marinovum sp. 2_MG-2023]|uniref:hypothetical protein n=1 Tax=Roseobacteraceae TaxID=2854170 RepID=UPI001FD1F107|nr:MULTISPECIES: hypothetical protein [Roseobacteraceae]MCJ7871785.1 hypothetical protein [Phaeobacter sp. J2-8]MDO6728625.1 hypothetical protein [Marinovum sp. 2_MG-2023]MDO6777959.1 hypothetical protein [Marinovum sp. 1_MG-2023]
MDRRSFMFSAAALATPSLLSAAEPIKLRDLYGAGREFSDLAQELEGQRITVTGFMAPPLKAESSFFVLTKLPMAVCPFCETEAEWPNDILAVYTKRTVKVIPFNVKIDTAGTLSLGGFKDPDTGFVSRVRLLDATYG